MLSSSTKVASSASASASTLPAFTLTYSKYKVSTITATGCVNALIDLATFYSEVEIVPYFSEESGFVYIEYGLDKSKYVYRGYNKKLEVAKRKKKTTKRFDNQVTVILRLGADQYINVKVFKNGNVQMTGVKQVEQGSQVIVKVIEQVTAMQERGVQVTSTVGALVGSNYKVCLINSDFKVNMDIKRDKLNKLVQTEYGIYCSFEPCIYPGVKIQYCWNTDIGEGNGVCSCSCECDGKGDGRGDGRCKKITIAVFQSGCIIITGAQKYEQIDDAYVFICDLLQKHAALLKKPLAPQKVAKEPKPITVVDDVSKKAPKKPAVVLDC